MIVSDTGTVISLETGVVLTGATVSIRVKKPSGIVVTWPAVTNGTRIETTTTSESLDEPGVYVLQGVIQNLGSWSGRTTAATLAVGPKL